MTSKTLTIPEKHINRFMYINLQTGNVGNYDDWEYETDYGLPVNAVDRGEVVKVQWDFKTQSWIIAQRNNNAKNTSSK